MDLRSLEQENIEYLKRLSKKKIPFVMGICLILLFTFYGIFETGFSIIYIFALIGLLGMGIILSNFTNL